MTSHRLLVGLLLLAAPAHAAPDRGELAFRQRCMACHKANGGSIGPDLAGVVGRRAGSLPGYRYSPALGAATLVWNATSLDRFLSQPAAVVPGTRMAVAIPDAATRREIIAYLQTAGGAQ